SVGDIDGDASKSLEVVVGTRDGFLFAWTTKGRSSGPIQWESMHHDNANTGNYATRLDQGSTQRPAAPLDCSLPVTAAADKFEAGGCVCNPMPTTNGRAAAASAAGLGILAATIVRRRRRNLAGRSPS